MFHSLNRSEKGVVVNSGEVFGDLKDNIIIKSFEELLDEIYTSEVQ